MDEINLFIIKRQAQYNIYHIQDNNMNHSLLYMQSSRIQINKIQQSHHITHNKLMQSQCLPILHSLTSASTPNIHTLDGRKIYLYHTPALINSQSMLVNTHQQYQPQISAVGRINRATNNMQKYNNPQVGLVNSSVSSHQVKINFVYSKKQHQTVHPSLMTSSKFDHKNNYFVNQQKGLFFSFPLKKMTKTEKQLRLKICSNLYNQILSQPKTIKKSYNKNKIPELSIKSNVHTKCSDHSIQLNQIQPNQLRVLTYQSYNGGKRSISDQQMSHKNQHQFYSHHNHSIKPSLVDQLPLNKQLKKTIMVNNYDFGGIYQDSQNYSITINKKQDSSIPVNAQLQQRHWNSHVTCLIVPESDKQSMKYSIHCSPDIRHQQLKQDILTGFGRQIQQSFIPD